MITTASIPAVLDWAAAHTEGLVVVLLMLIAYAYGRVVGQERARGAARATPDTARVLREAGVEPAAYGILRAPWRPDHVSEYQAGDTLALSFSTDTDLGNGIVRSVFRRARIFVERTEAGRVRLAHEIKNERVQIRVRGNVIAEFPYDKE